MCEFAERYTAAWNSGLPERVAEYFSRDGWLRVNGGAVARGREAIAETARGFLEAFPDMLLRCDGVSGECDSVTYRWTFTGTYVGTGRKVMISGREIWKLAEDGLIAESEGSFDVDDYARQCGI